MVTKNVQTSTTQFKRPNIRRFVTINCQDKDAILEHSNQDYMNLKTLVLQNYDKEHDQDSLHRLFLQNTTGTQRVKTLVVKMTDVDGPKIPLSDFTNIERLIIMVPNKVNHFYTKREITDLTENFPEEKFMFIRSPQPISEIRELHFYFEE